MKTRWRLHLPVRLSVLLLLLLPRACSAAHINPLAAVASQAASSVGGVGGPLSTLVDAPRARSEREKQKEQYKTELLRRMGARDRVALQRQWGSVAYAEAQQVEDLQKVDSSLHIDFNILASGVDNGAEVNFNGQPQTNKS